MTTSFRIPHTVIRRNIGTWINGVYKMNEDQGTQQSIMATIQMPSSGDQQLIQATPYGERRAKFIKLYTDTRLQPPTQVIVPGEIEYPGDIIKYDNRYWLVFGEADFTALKRKRSTQVSHYRYFGCELIEGFKMDDAPS